uniref:Arabidopsis retrotransposon Orf1 C-terminal domain-containing protein n=1 Tax=Chenopodium quinoa TaxID=63459 RepID=A0A803M5N8_CHEQI
MSSYFKRGVVATRYGDLDTLTTLHIEDDIRWLFDNVRMGNLLMTKFPTSQRATLEFLSSLKVQLFPNPSSGETKITFRLFNNDHTWNLNNLNLAFGLQGGGSRMTPIRWDVDDLWRILTGEGTYDSKRSSITSVRHPALRYTLNILSNIGAFFIQQLQHVANNNTTGGKFVQGGFITHIANYLGYNEELKRDGFVDGIDAVEIPSSWLKKKDGTTL